MYLCIAPRVILVLQVPPLVMLLSGSADDAVLRNAAAALANLALAEALRGKLVGDGAVWPLVQLVSSASDSQVLGNAAAALRNLARDEASRPRIVQEGAVGPLVQVRSLAPRCNMRNGIQVFV